LLDLYLKLSERGALSPDGFLQLSEINEIISALCTVALSFVRTALFLYAIYSLVVLNVFFCKIVIIIRLVFFIPPFLRTLCECLEQTFHSQTSTFLPKTI